MLLWRRWCPTTADEDRLSRNVVRQDLSEIEALQIVEGFKARQGAQAALTSLSRSGCRSRILNNFTSANGGLVLPFS